MIERKTKRIAIMTRAHHSYHIQVGWGFLEAIDGNKDIDWVPIMFFCREADRRTMYEQMKEVALGTYDLIITVGSMRAEITSKFIREHNLNIPMVFVGVSDPVRLGVLSEFKSDKTITGVWNEQMPFVFMAKIFHKIKPTMKRILIPYFESSEGGYMQAKLKEGSEYLSSVGVECLLLPLQEVRPYPEQVIPLLPVVDALWSVEGGFLDVFSRPLIKLCEAHSVTFFSNNRAHVGIGASIVLGADIKPIAHALFEQAFEILEHDRPPDLVPIKIVLNNRGVLVNIEAAQRQNFEINEALLFGLCNAEVIEEHFVIKENL